MTDRTILLLEDDPAVARAILRALVAEGFEPTIAPSCAVARSIQQLFDIGIFDIDLRDGSSLPIARAMTMQGQVGRAVFFTGSTDQQMLAEAATLGTVLGKQQGIPALLRELDGSLRTVAESGIVPVGAKGWVNWRWGVG